MGWTTVTEPFTHAIFRVALTKKDCKGVDFTASIIDIADSIEDLLFDAVDIELLEGSGFDDTTCYSDIALELACMWADDNTNTQRD